MPDVTKQRMTAEELRKARKLSEEMVGHEFELGIAPYLNYQGPIKSEDANYLGFKGDKPRVGIQGFIGTGGEEPYMEGEIDGELLSVPDGPKGSVNAVDKGASAATYAHEYRHKQRPSATELTIRGYDGYNAQNEEDFQEAILLYGQKVGSETMEEAEAGLIAMLKRMEDRKTDAMNDNPYWKTRKKDKPKEPKKPEINSEQEFWDAIEKDYKEDKESTRGKW